MTPKLSLLTACYNDAAFLPDCIASVRRQTVYDIEHIIVIDGATDNSASLAYQARDADCRVRVIRFSTNKGQSHALNKATAYARAPWVMKVDADDTISPNYVEQILWAADEDPRRNVIFSPAQHFGTRTDVYRYPAFNPSKIIDTLMMAGNAAIKKSVLCAVGGYDETMRFAMDWDFYIRAQLAVGLVPHQLSQPLWQYRIHKGPRMSAEGIGQLPHLRNYWKGHTKETALQRSRTWGNWYSELIAMVERRLTA